MKKVFVFILALAAFACSEQKGFNIKVDLKGAENMVLLQKYTNGVWTGIDTAEVVDGVAVLEGEVPYPGIYYLGIEGKRQKAPVFVENTNMKIEGNVDSLAQVNVTGSVTHDEYVILNSRLKKVRDDYMVIYQEARELAQAGDAVKSEELMVKVREIYEDFGALQEDFIKENPASYATPYILTSLSQDKEVDELQALVENLDPKLDEVQEIKDIKERITALAAVAVGQVAPDFSQNDANGNSVKLSDIYSKNELTLIDFWASWCGPCRQENPNVVAVFEEFKVKGFSVFGVSLDEDKDKWLKAIKDDKLAWDHVSDLGGWGNAAAKLYSVNSIPASLLVDKNGKIVAKDKRGEELKETVADFLN